MLIQYLGGMNVQVLGPNLYKRIQNLKIEIWKSRIGSTYVSSAQVLSLDLGCGKCRIQNVNWKSRIQNRNAKIQNIGSKYNGSERTIQKCRSRVKILASRSRIHQMERQPIILRCRLIDQHKGCYVHEKIRYTENSLLYRKVTSAADIFSSSLLSQKVFSKAKKNN